MMPSAFMENSVPVIVESRKSHGDFKMGRCNYLTVQCDSPSPGWQLDLVGQSTSYLMLGLTGVIRYPLGGGTFDSVQQIEDLFNRIEEREELYLDVDDLWVPDFVLWQTLDQYRAGQVFRLSDELFTRAYSFREGMLEQESYLAYCQELREQATPSAAETEAFTAWHWEQVEAARDQYKNNMEKGLVLGRVGPQGATK